MNLALYVSVAEACKIAGVSKPYVHVLIKAGKLRAQKVGNSYAILRADVEAFERKPGMGRPKKADPARPGRAKAKGRSRPVRPPRKAKKPRR